MEIEQRLSSVLRDFARTLSTDFAIQAILDNLVVRIVDILPVTGAGVTLISPGGVPWSAASEDLSLRLQHLQAELDEGPCLAAYEAGVAVAVPDLRVDHRLPKFSPSRCSGTISALCSSASRSTRRCSCERYAREHRAGPRHGKPWARDVTCLLVEDDPKVAGLVRPQLEVRGIDVIVAGTLATARDALRRLSVDTVILDLTLPDGSGLELLQELRSAGATVTVIVLSGASSEADRVQALDLGADDYVVKPFFTSELVARVLAVRRRRDLDRDQRLRAGRLEINLAARQVTAEGAPVDLTSKEFDLLAFLSLVTPPAASTRLRHLATGVFSDLSDAVVVTDMHFQIRSWNDAAERLYGWPEHEVLGLHVSDVLGPAGSNDDAWQALEMVGRWHGERREATRDGAGVTVRASTTLIEDDRGDAIGIVSVNRPVFAVTEVAGAFAASDAADIRRGIEQGEFVVHYQPIVALADGSMTSLEALIRWNHPARGLLAPAAFMGTAERSGLIVELGSFVLDTACRQMAEWRRFGFDLYLAVNLSARELADPELEDRVTATLASSGLDAGALWLEVTETALVADVKQASELLHRLADRGVHVAIDDFGTGWASLTYLKTFPVDVLKIDRLFVEGVEQGANEVAIVRSVLSLGAELGLTVIAEGIETIGQQKALESLGCSLGQGFLLGRPTPGEDVPLTLARRIAEPSRTGQPRPQPERTADRRGARTGRMRAGDGPGRRPAGVARGAAPTPSRLSVAVAVAVDESPEAGAMAKPGGEPFEHECVSGMLRGVLRVHTAEGAVALLEQAVRQLGGRLVLASEGDTAALPIDISLGEGPPMLAAAEPLSVARMQLERTLPRLVEDARQAIDLLRQAERLTVETNHDLLTGLANRRVLDRVLPRIEEGVIVMIDLDHFKAVNDGSGHAAGDAVLARFGRLLADEVRMSDTTCRVGGEEFVIVLPAVEVATAVELVDRIRASWTLVAPQPITFSAGIAAASSTGGTAALLAADQAMYLAKSNGRNRTELAADQDDLG